MRDVTIFIAGMAWGIVLIHIAMVIAWRLRTPNNDLENDHG